MLRECPKCFGAWEDDAEYGMSAYEQHLLYEHGLDDDEYEPWDFDRTLAGSVNKKVSSFLARRREKKEKEFEEYEKDAGIGSDAMNSFSELRGENLRVSTVVGTLEEGTTVKVVEIGHTSKGEKHLYVSNDEGDGQWVKLMHKKRLGTNTHYFIKEDDAAENHHIDSKLIPKEDSYKIFIEQGHMIERPSSLFVSISQNREKIRSVKVGGESVTIIKGVISI